MVYQYFYRREGMPYKDTEKRKAIQRDSQRKRREGLTDVKAGVDKPDTIEEMKASLRNVPYSPYDVMSHIEAIQEQYSKITMEDRIERAMDYLKFWTTVRPEKIRAYREAQGL